MSTVKVFIEDIKIKSLAPTVTDPEILKLIPTTVIPNRIEFVIFPVSAAVSNAIRRTVLCELPVRAMYARHEDFTKTDDTDPEIINEMIIKRLRMIPLLQSCPLSATFSLSAVNHTPITREVKVSEIVPTSNYPKGSKLPFNDTFTLCTLLPGKELEIKKIAIDEAYGYSPERGMHAVGMHAVSLPRGCVPPNAYDPVEGSIPSSLADPRRHQIAFDTNGTMPADKIVVMACDSLISRLKIVQSLLPNIETQKDVYYLFIPGMTDSIGNMLTKTILDLYPDIDAVTYSANNIDYQCTMKVRCNMKIDDVFTNTIKHLIDLFEAIKAYF